MSLQSNLTSFQVFCCMYPECGKEYGSKFNLKRHVQVYHHRIKQVECEVCRKVFRVRQNLIEHSYIHTGQKPYACGLCGERFRHKATFLAHKRKKLCKCLNQGFDRNAFNEYQQDCLNF